MENKNDHGKEDIDGTNEKEMRINNPKLKKENIALFVETYFQEKINTIHHIRAINTKNNTNTFQSKDGYYEKETNYRLANHKENQKNNIGHDINNDTRIISSILFFNMELIISNDKNCDKNENYGCIFRVNFYF